MGLVSSIASVVGIKTTAFPVSAALGVLDPVSGDSSDFQAFQYFPENVTDTRAPNYISRPIPGGSHPIYTFIDGGERTISFSAVFTADEAPAGGGSAMLGLLTGKKSISLLGKSERQDTVDIPAAIAWLRSFTYPTYYDDVAASPPPCVVWLPKSGIIGAGNFVDSIVGIMTGCTVTYEAFHRNGTPRIAVVALEFKEIVQTISAWRFHGAEDFEDISGSYKRKILE